MPSGHRPSRREDTCNWRSVAPAARWYACNNKAYNVHSYTNTLCHAVHLCPACKVTGPDGAVRGSCDRDGDTEATDSDLLAAAI